MDVFNSSTTNDVFNTFLNLFNELYQVHFPVKKYSMNKKSEISPHITPALQKSITERNRLERLAKNAQIHLVRDI